MTLLVLRLAAPLQSWSGYRHQLNIQSSVPTEAIPRKSAVSGVIGAALGPDDNGFGSARDLAALGDRYSLSVRVEARNPPTEDFQVLGPLSPEDTDVAERIGRIGSASTARFPSKRGGGNFPTTVSRKDYLSHSEFIAALDTDDATARAWLSALRAPVFMTYLGRKSCAPTFPFVLGVTDASRAEIFAELPHVRRHNERTTSAQLTGYDITGGYGVHHANAHPAPYTPQNVEQRREQLLWVREHFLQEVPQ